jgi:D-alanyl-D-alanine carboxypeptidase
MAEAWVDRFRSRKGCFAVAQLSRRSLVACKKRNPRWNVRRCERRRFECDGVTYAPCCLETEPAGSHVLLSAISSTASLQASPLCVMIMRVFMAGLAMAGGLRADDTQDISGKLEQIRVRHGVPALATAAVVDGEIVAGGVAGSRRADGAEKVALGDKWHLGSCTKSMTAAVAAMLVEDGLLTWDTRIAASFPEFATEIHASWREVTLEQLLLHRGGAPRALPEDLWKGANRRIGSPNEQRTAFVKALLVLESEQPAEAGWIYSDAGYAIAGAMMEQAAGKPWEQLLRERLFQPLGLKSAGFGEPATVGHVNQPWGHRGSEPPYTPVPSGTVTDYPPAIGPAATVHMNITDFARYAAWHVAGHRGDHTALLSHESMQKLHAAPADEHRYAMGWALVERKSADGMALMHSGNNEMFYAVMWMKPAQDTCFVAACNADGPLAEQACDDAIAMLINNL